MRFAPDEDEVMVEDTLDRVLAEAVANAPRIDGEAPMPDPAALRARLGELGLWGAWLPEAAGGAGGGARLLMTLARGLGRKPSQTGYLGGCVLPGALLARSDAPEAAALLERMAGGEAMAAAALLESGRRWALDAEATTAREDGDGFVLAGEKAHVAEAEGAEALLVSAAEPGGTGVFLVPADAPGLEVGAWKAVDGSAWATVRFDGLRLPASARLFGPNAGPAAIEESVGVTAFAAAAEILGACEASFAMTLEYLRTREQFGKPLAKNQALQFRAADLHAEIELLRGQVLGAVNALEQGWTPRARSEVAAAAAMAAETGDLAGREAIHLHGAIGMTRELGVGRYLMRANTLAQWLGGASHHRAAFLAAEEEAAA